MQPADSDEAVTVLKGNGLYGMSRLWHDIGTHLRPAGVPCAVMRQQLLQPSEGDDP